MPDKIIFVRRRKTEVRGKISNKGFTIIELLVVIAIFTFLVSLIFVQFQMTKTRARDAEREKEIKTIQNALAIYVTSTRSYPIYSGAITGSDPVSVALLTTGSIEQIPFDPLNTGNFVYRYDSADGTTYTLTYWLETNSIPGKSAGRQTATP